MSIPEVWPSSDLAVMLQLAWIAGILTSISPTADGGEPHGAPLNSVSRQVRSNAASDPSPSTKTSGCRLGPRATDSLKPFPPRSLTSGATLGSEQRESDVSTSVPAARPA